MSAGAAGAGAAAAEPTGTGDDRVNPSYPPPRDVLAARPIRAWSPTACPSPSSSPASSPSSPSAVSTASPAPASVPSPMHDPARAVASAAPSPLRSHVVVLNVAVAPAPAAAVAASAGKTKAAVEAPGEAAPKPYAFGFGRWCLVLTYALVMAGDVLSVQFSGPFMAQYLVGTAGYSTATVSVANGACWWASIATLVLHTWLTSGAGPATPTATASTTTNATPAQWSGNKPSALTALSAWWKAFRRRYGAQGMLFAAVTGHGVALLLVTITAAGGGGGDSGSAEAEADAGGNETGAGDGVSRALIPAIIAGRVLQGVASAFVWVYATVAACDLFPASASDSGSSASSSSSSSSSCELQTKFALSVLSLAGTVGELTAPLCGTALYVESGSGGAGLYGSYLALTCIVAGVWVLFAVAHCLVPFTPAAVTAAVTAATGAASEPAAVGAAAADPQAPARDPSANPALDPVVVAVSVALALTDMQYGVTTIVAPLYLAYGLGVGDATVGWVLAVFSAAYVATAALLTAAVANPRCGARISPRHAIACGLALLVAADALFTAAPDAAARASGGGGGATAGAGAGVAVLMAIEAVAGAANAVNVVLAPHYIAARSRALGFASADRCMGVFFLFFFSGRGLGLALTALWPPAPTDAVAQQTLLWGVAAAPLALAVPAFWWLTRPRPPVPSPAPAPSLPAPVQVHVTLCADPYAAAPAAVKSRRAPVPVPVPTSVAAGFELQLQPAGVRVFAREKEQQLLVPAPRPAAAHAHRCCVHSTSSRYLRSAAASNSKPFEFEFEFAGAGGDSTSASASAPVPRAYVRH